ncbi:hypothetical protein D3C73_944740 [compost metagenome]
MPNALPGFVPHPFTVVFHIFGQAFGIAVELTFLDAEMDRRHILELRRNLNHRLTDHHRDRVEVRSIGGQP